MQHAVEKYSETVLCPKAAFGLVHPGEGLISRSAMYKKKTQIKIFPLSETGNRIKN
jgi:hypothetical protein